MSPWVPAALLNLIPSSTADKCTAFVKALIRIPTLLYDFFVWMISAEGNVTREFQNWLGIAVPGDVKGTFDTEDQTGWLECNGAIVSRTTYADLFDVIGINYGVGDGSTTFQLPDLRGRVVGSSGAGSGLTSRAIGATIGEEEHTITTDELPEHDHDFTVTANNADSTGTGELTGGQNDSPGDGSFSGTTSVNTTAANAMNVMQPTMFVRYLIKY